MAFPELGRIKMPFYELKDWDDTSAKFKDHSLILLLKKYTIRARIRATHSRCEFLVLDIERKHALTIEDIASFTVSF